MPVRTVEAAPAIREGVLKPMSISSSSRFGGLGGQDPFGDLLGRSLRAKAA
jgi:hypothetical protein